MLIIVKFNYYEWFAYSVGDALISSFLGVSLLNN
jgi:hypothetical protein